MNLDFHIKNQMGLMGSKKLRLGGELDIDQGSNKGFYAEIKNYSNGEVGSHLFGESVHFFLRSF